MARGTTVLFCRGLGCFLFLLKAITSRVGLTLNTRVPLDYSPSLPRLLSSLQVSHLQGVIPNEERPAAMERLQKAINDLIQVLFHYSFPLPRLFSLFFFLQKESLPVVVKSVKYEDIAENCGGSCPDYMPKGKEARIVTFKGVALAGTFFVF